MPRHPLLTEQGRSVTVWRKDSSGAWKCVIDIWNAAPAAAVPR
jgi:ketosteroid isomerase-like protein